ncbi:MAG: pseudouridine synthase, partial [Polyangiaceae bacterium]
TLHDAKPSRTRWRLVAKANGHALLACSPETGRTHQIRVHASHAGAPLLGDRAYGGSSRVTLANGTILSCQRICLHCAHIEIEKGRKKRAFSSPIPADLRATWASLGGAASAWDTALACDLSFSSE